MSGFTSSIPLCKAELVERWGGVTYNNTPSTRFSGLPSVVAALASGTTDIRVSWGNPYPDSMPDVVVIVDDVKDITLHPVAAMTQYNESYAITCYISIAKHPNTDKLEMWTRAYALYAEIVTDIYRMNREGDMPPQVNVIEVGPAHDQDAIASDVRENAVMFDLLVKARIT